jgi:hypothetical protein
VHQKEKMTAKTPKSKKAKGTRLEHKVASEIRAKLKIDAKRMPMSGAMPGFKGDIYSPEFPFTIECKNQEKIRFWEFWEQAREQKGYKPPMLVISGNHRPILAVVEIEELLNLIRTANESLSMQEL